jgi:hypothetical protein
MLIGPRQHQRMIQIAGYRPLDAENSKRQLPDSVRVVSTIREQHRLREHRAEQNRSDR